MHPDQRWIAATTTLNPWKLPRYCFFKTSEIIYFIIFQTCFRCTSNKIYLSTFQYDQYSWYLNKKIRVASKNLKQSPCVKTPRCGDSTLVWMPLKRFVRMFVPSTHLHSSTVRMHLFLYVRPSVPHTGSCSSEHLCSHVAPRDRSHFEEATTNTPGT